MSPVSMLLDICPGVGREVMWCSFCIVLLVTVVRLSWSIGLDRELTRRKCKASMRRKSRNVKKGRKPATCPRHRGGLSRVSLESVKSALVAAIMVPLRRLVISLPKPSYRAPRDSDTVGVRKGAGRRKKHKTDEEADAECHPDTDNVEACAAALEGLSGPALANSDAAVQATEDGAGAMEGWTIVERACRRQHSSVSDSTSCSSSDRNAAGRKQGRSRSTPSPPVQPCLGRRSMGYTKAPPLRQKLPIRKQDKPKEKHGRDGGRIGSDRIDNTITQSKRHVWGVVEAARSLEGPLVSSIASSEDAPTYTARSMGKVAPSTAAPSECRLLEESPRSLLDSLCVAEPLYPDWVQRLMDECEDDDKQDLPQVEYPSPDPSVDSVVVVAAAAAPEFSPVFSIIYDTLHPCGIWVGLNHLVRKIGYASGAWEMIWNLADIGWIQLSDCGLYCRLGERWGKYETMLSPPDEVTDKDSAVAVYSDSVDYFPLSDWEVGDNRLSYDRQDSIVGSSEGHQQDPMGWAPPPTLPRGFANPPAMIIGLIK
ncbi:hypothetical protein FOL47_003110 [Perkinsus chesapeaki]|uniref:Uncharacterized protein n=1 Tax=Perkinsus chesapeaki TaxID=330153 RepID=A0A7J6M9R4_PERCH|nr:hypothetical protein FOL47_003110 [Perkinsus chesapeaki]